MKEYLVAVDIAKKADFFAYMVFKRHSELVQGAASIKAADRFVKHLYIVAIDKLQGITYPAMADIVASRMNHRELVNNADLVVDGTGVGEAAVDLMRERGLAPIPIVFTASGQVREVYASIGEVFAQAQGKLAPIKTLKEIHVPKEDLVTAGQRLLQEDRVRVAEGVAWLDDFREQLAGFKGKVNERTSRTKYEAETEELHDDLVVCYLMAAWYFTREGLQDIPDIAVPNRTIRDRMNVATGYDPADFQ